MKRKKTIVIKNPQLRRFRNNLRLVLLKAVSDKWYPITEEIRGLTYKEDGTPRDFIDMDEIHFLNEKRNELDSLSSDSICKCATCNVADKDMTFNPYFKAWFCVDCYKINRSYYRKEGDHFSFE